MMPPDFRIIVAGSGAGINLVPLSARVIRQLDRVVLDLHHQRVDAGAQRLGDLELEGRKKSLVRSTVIAIDEGMGLVVNALEAEENRARSSKVRRQLELPPVIRDGTAKRTTVMRDLHCFPSPLPGQHAREALRVRSDLPRKRVEGDLRPLHRKGRCQPMQEGRNGFLERIQVRTNRLGRVTCGERSEKLPPGSGFDRQENIRKHGRLRFHAAHRPIGGLRRGNKGKLIGAA